MAQHAIVHVEFPSTDPSASARFYGDLFGWKIHEDAEMEYAMFDPEERPGGGFPRVSDLYNVGGALVYISTDDIDASLAKVESLGGSTVSPKMEIPGIGWFAVFSDISGNRVALYTAADGHA